MRGELEEGKNLWAPLGKREVSKSRGEKIPELKESRF